jgi:hypothetical protein
MISTLSRRGFLQNSWWVELGHDARRVRAIPRQRDLSECCRASHADPRLPTLGDLRYVGHSAADSLSSSWRHCMVPRLCTGSSWRTAIGRCLRGLEVPVDKEASYPRGGPVCPEQLRLGLPIFLYGLVGPRRCGLVLSVRFRPPARPPSG